MKKIEAIIKPFKLDEVKAVLGAIDAKGLTVAEVKRCGLGPYGVDPARGSDPDGAPQVKLEIITEDDRADLVARAIEHAARTGRDGDGTITILSVDDAVRIRTGERGDHAV